MRHLLLLLLALSLAASAAAQDNTSGDNATGAPTDGADAPAEGGDAAAPPEPITIEMEGHQQGSALFFTLKGETQRNPTITVQPGQKVTFVLTIVSGVHNLNINGAAKTAILSDGETATLEWTAPDTPGSIEYWCDPHKSAGMRGRISVGALGGGDGGSGSEGGSITGETIDLGQFDPSCEGKVAPAIVREGIVGSPTLQDYIDGCKTKVEGGEDDSHPADLVIPITWGLVGLGIVGVVWVHKYYKP